MTPKPRVRWTEIFRSRRLAVLFALGFSSGLPLLLVGQTLIAWMTVEGVDIKKIAAFSSVGLAYTFKFAWAPLLDRYRLPFLGRRRGWMITLQLLLVAAIATMGFSSPKSAPLEMAVLAVITAFLSASQDVVLDAYSTDLLTPEQRPAGSAIYVLGYRVAMMITGTVAFILADHVEWRYIYGLMAALMFVGVIATLFAEEPSADHVTRPRTIFHAIVLPFVRFYQRYGPTLALVLLFAATYKFGDFLIDSLKITFYKRILGFSLTEIGTVNKLFILAGAAVGSAVVGLVAPRLGVRRALLVFGLIQAATNLLFVVLASMGKSYVWLGVAVFFDNFAGTMGTAVFVAFLMSLCSKEVSATQYALLTSLSSVGLRVFGWTGGPLVEQFGWDGFFVATALMAIPGLLLIPFLPVPATEETKPTATRAAPGT